MDDIALFGILIESQGDTSLYSRHTTLPPPTRRHGHDPFDPDRHPHRQCHRLRRSRPAELAVHRQRPGQGRRPGRHTLGYIGSTGLPFPTLALAVALLIELGFATALLVGYRTRLVATVMAGFTLATALAFHNQFGDQNQLIHFLKNLAIAGGLLQVAAFGAGALSLDAYRSRRTAHA
ncbi:Uncharacterized membrane protein YphA, DoxX/SURF4 family [Azotobacter beijerinckii]|uniref:Uncharacterized membrane protein YphA, DoxX/SURF4 family n=1 Tax=Azotobacter beijerinckii TaxID=170623 RepID=A0A1H6XCK5_9GAMM|nr:Uncharacterized membrane protein YphA, DoxX/SURF4 family [Azotobacter beijerinckii]